MSERLAQLQVAVESMHGCPAQHVASKPVVEFHRGSVLWEGDVETFELTGHSQAKRCYAWVHVDLGEPQYFTVLEIPPVDSAESAVKIALKAE